ncbi:MAG: rhodanese-like domain-containing protein [Acidiferrobacter sp.]
MRKTSAQLVTEAKSQIKEIDAVKARDAIAAGVLVIDVREPHEYAEGHIPGAINIPRGTLEFSLDKHEALADETKPVIVYCRVGGRGAMAAHTLQHHFGYQNVASLEGGLDAWIQKGHKIHKP